MIDFVIFLPIIILILISSGIFVFLLKKQDLLNRKEKYFGISIIIAAKNEEKNIPSLIQSLKKLNYPQEKFEVIIVDDNSEDNTFSVSKRLTEGTNIRVIKSENKEYPSKKGALALGIGQADFDFIMITDADCVVPKDWLSLASEFFSDEYDFIFGVAPYVSNRNMVSKISSYEDFRNHILTFAAAKLSIPYSAAARNFGFKKSSFFNLGGYKYTLETFSGDDDLLIRQAVKNRMKVGAFVNKEFFVYSWAPKSFSGYLRQRGRHVSTSHYYSFKIKLILAIWHVTNLLAVLSIFFTPFSLLFVIPFLVKVFADTVSSLILQSNFGYKFNFFEVIIFQICYEILLIINFVNSFGKKQRW